MDSQEDQWEASKKNSAKKSLEPSKTPGASTLTQTPQLEATQEQEDLHSKTNSRTSKTLTSKQVASSNNTTSLHLGNMSRPQVKILTHHLIKIRDSMLSSHHSNMLNMHSSHLREEGVLISLLTINRTHFTEMHRLEANSNKQQTLMASHLHPQITLELEVLEQNSGDNKKKFKLTNSKINF